MEIIDGRQVARSVLEKLAAEIAALPSTLPRPAVTFIRVGEDPASVSYVNGKQRTAEHLGIESSVRVFPKDISAQALHAEIRGVNENPAVHGILVQSPLPGDLDEQQAFNAVDPDKDIDGLHTLNTGKLVQEDDSGFAPCTPSGILELLHQSGIDPAGRHVVILGRSLLVGKPLALLLSQKRDGANATVTVCHSRSTGLSRLARQADILVAAIGKAHFVTADMVKPGATVIDVGVNRIPDSSRKRGYRLTGDVDFDEVAKVAGRITPVPGGVGPMTVAMLMKNTFKAYCRAVGL